MRQFLKQAKASITQARHQARAAVWDFEEHYPNMPIGVASFATINTAGFFLASAWMVPVCVFGSAYLSYALVTQARPLRTRVLIPGPWDFMVPHDKTPKVRHYQSLSRIAQRTGMITTLTFGACWLAYKTAVNNYLPPALTDQLDDGCWNAGENLNFSKFGKDFRITTLSLQTMEEIVTTTKALSEPGKTETKHWERANFDVSFMKDGFLGRASQEVTLPYAAEWRLAGFKAHGLGCRNNWLPDPGNLG